MLWLVHSMGLFGLCLVLPYKGIFWRVGLGTFWRSRETVQGDGAAHRIGLQGRRNLSGIIQLSPSRPGLSRLSGISQESLRVIFRCVGRVRARVRIPKYANSQLANSQTQGASVRPNSQTRQVHPQKTRPNSQMDLTIIILLCNVVITPIKGQFSD